MNQPHTVIKHLMLVHADDLVAEKLANRWKSIQENPQLTTEQLTTEQLNELHGEVPEDQVRLYTLHGLILNKSPSGGDIMR